ncbi:MAG: DUF1572 family protein [Planctomycetaceae bacterium]|nr:DUF1572 family protein [Planctomycetaceae bacterium]
MEPSAQNLMATVSQEAIQELEDALGKIKHCLGQLDDEQIWWRPIPTMNSIANLVLHLCGNVRQWIVSGVGGVEDKRNRPQEFSERGPIGSDELLGRLEATITEAKEAIARASAKDLLATRRIQGFDVTGFGAIFHSVSHFRGHTQEIVHMTRFQLGEHYQFDFVPTTPEQGAS